jgi:ubiquinone/menaquinone biosynthesis C-methylase UbiE
MVEVDLPKSRKIRESGMPAQDVWRTFFDIERILKTMQINSDIVDAADFCCGYGTFTLPVAQRISGLIYALDIDPEMIRSVNEKSSKLGLVNVRAIVRDLMCEGSGLESDGLDYVMLFNILHSEEPLTLLREAFRVLKEGGRIGIIHWLRDLSTPRGPPLNMRPTVEQCVDWCLQAGFSQGSDESVDLKPYNFGLVMKK